MLPSLEAHKEGEENKYCYIYVCTYTYIYIYTYMCTCVCVQRHTHTHGVLEREEGNTPRGSLEDIHVRRLVLPRESLLVSDPVHRNVLEVLVGQLLDGGVDGLWGKREYQKRGGGWSQEAHVNLFDLIVPNRTYITS